jgi:hypothetical protein
MPPQMVLHTDPGSEPFERGFFLQRPPCWPRFRIGLSAGNSAVRHSSCRFRTLDRGSDSAGGHSRNLLVARSRRFGNGIFSGDLIAGLLLMALLLRIFFAAGFLPRLRVSAPRPFRVVVRETPCIQNLRRTRTCRRAAVCRSGRPLLANGFPVLLSLRQLGR